MNELKIIYGNITLSNILLSIDQINKISIKLSDYGLNKSLKNNLNSQSYWFQIILILLKFYKEM